MLKRALTKYIKDLQDIINRQDATEESFYGCLEELIKAYAEINNIKNCNVTVLPKPMEAGNPDFCIRDGSNRITGYIEAKKPETYNLGPIAESGQLKRYRNGIANLILTNFYEFWLFQHGVFKKSVTIASPINATQMNVPPPVANVDEFADLFQHYFSFSLPAITDPQSLADALAKHTRYLKEQIIFELDNNKETKYIQALLEFYEAFKDTLIHDLKLKDFADLFAQTLTYGIFVARTRSKEENFDSRLINSHIPNSLGILKSIFKFIDYEERPQSIDVLIQGVVDILFNTEIEKIMQSFDAEGKGSDPIVHFYETFLSEYNPRLKEKRT
ncbi:MAG: DNA methyltransferase, partial [Candidatus Cloacimonetes bacterium]|nr:DNA methyltransferase [Candidatus Cloacimonadota bacterium]